MNEVTVRQLTIGSGRPKICLPLVGRTQAELLAEGRQAAGLPGDLIEWRLDHFNALSNQAELLATAQALRDVLGGRPLLATFRTFAEGGVTPMPLAAYVALYRCLLQSGLVDLLDVEYALPAAEVRALIAAAHDQQVPVILSNHDFEGTPPQAELVRRLEEMESFGADICKIAVMPHSPQDVLNLLGATVARHEGGAQTPLITMAMGKLGLISRVTGEIFGSSVTFGAIAQTSAPGQLPSRELHDFLESFALEQA